MKRAVPLWFLCSLLLFAIAPDLHAATASFIGTSTANTFGKDGYVIPLATPAPPSYATLNVAGDATWNWPPACWYTPDPVAPGSSFTIVIGLTDGKTHEVTLWLLDQDVQSRAETITITDASSGATLDTESASSFTSPGKYLSWSVSGNIVAKVTLTGGRNAVVSGVYFDTPSTPSGPSVCANIGLAWTASTTAGATYNVYRNGVKLNGTPITGTTYSDGSGTAGTAYTYTVTSILNGMESAPQPIQSLVFP